MRTVTLLIIALMTSWLWRVDLRAEVGLYHKREMRAAWITTAWGLDWPSRQGRSRATIAAQKQQLDTLLSDMKQMGMNAVLFQVRSMADAMYHSSFEPWSRFLTGERGVAPADSRWDPLAYCVERCHQLGMECHAWVNPLRVSTGKSYPTTPTDKKIKERGWTLAYARNTGKKSVTTTTILNPGLKDVRDYVTEICREIVGKYDIDGLVFDDYFYPEGIPLGAGYDYDLWRSSKSALSQDDWRRENIRVLIGSVYAMIQEEKPYVRFGVSPAGVAGGDGRATDKHGLPSCYAGHDWMYDGISCDPISWLADGTVDYVSPQIYWRTDNATNPFVPISKWWSEVAGHFGRHFFASHTLDGSSDEKPTDKASERSRQIAGNRQNAPEGQAGTMLYSIKNLKGEAGGQVKKHLADKCFRYRAIPPAMTWKGKGTPGPVDGLHIDGTRLVWTGVNDSRYVIYAVDKNGSETDEVTIIDDPSAIVDMTYLSEYKLGGGVNDGQVYGVSALDRYGNESEIVWVDNSVVIENALSREVEMAILDEVVEQVIERQEIERKVVVQPPVVVECSEHNPMVTEVVISEKKEEPTGRYVVELGCCAQSARLFDGRGNLAASGREVERLSVERPGVYVLRMVDDRGNPVTRKVTLSD